MLEFNNVVFSSFVTLKHGLLTALWILSSLQGVCTAARAGDSQSDQGLHHHRRTTEWSLVVFHGDRDGRSHISACEGPLSST